MRIRQESKMDYEKVFTVVKDAFATAEHSDGKEQELVNALRKSNAFIPDLSLVAEVNGKIVGHIMFTKAEVDNCTILALAPLSVLPEYQKQGIGAALIQRGHTIAKSLGYPFSVVLGIETYYPRFGYVEAKQLGIEAPFKVSSENFMAIKLQETAKPVHGVIRYAPEFGS